MRTTEPSPMQSDLQPGGRATTTTGFFRGVVKNNADSQGMGRVAVYIPSFGGDPNDERTWYTASYMSSFAGSTNPLLNTTDGQTENDTQDSFGSFATGYSIGASVIISFVDGNSAFPIVVGSMFDQNMTNSVAGYPTGNSTEGDVGGVNPPVTEYNKRDEDINPREPERPIRTQLTEQLWRQGLFNDFLRGQHDTSPMRDPVPQFMSMKTPGGNTFVIDDGKIDPLSGGGDGIDGRTYPNAAGATPYIRMRTANGTQVMIDSSSGFVYMNSKNGSSWFQLAENGIQLYTDGDLNLRSEDSFGKRSDGDDSLEVLGGMNITTGGTFAIESNGVNILSGGHTAMKTADLHLKAAGDVKMQAAWNYTEKAGNINQDKKVFVGIAQDANDVEPLSTGVVTDKPLTTNPEMRTAELTSMQDAAAANGPYGSTSEPSGTTTLPTGEFLTHEPNDAHGKASGEVSSFSGLSDQALIEANIVSDISSPQGSGSDIVAVVDYGPGYNVVRLADGTTVRREGNWNWRNNNPGNIRNSPSSPVAGASIPYGGDFMMFPSYEAGRQAHEDLLFGPGYIDRSISGAITRWAPPSENNTQAYINAVSQATGLPPFTPMAELNSTQRRQLQQAMERVEGPTAGRVIQQ